MFGLSEATSLPKVVVWTEYILLLPDPTMWKYIGYVVVVKHVRPFISKFTRIF